MSDSPKNNKVEDVSKDLYEEENLDTLIRYQDAFDVVAWLLSYFDYHKEASTLDDVADEESLNNEQLTTLSTLNHLTLTPCHFLGDNKLDDLAGSLPLLLIGSKNTVYVVLEKTIAHWKVFDLKHRVEKYLSLDEMIAIAPIEQYHVDFTEPKAETIEAETGFWDNWLIKEIFKHKKIYRDTLLASFIINLIALFIPLYTMSVYDKVVPNLAFDTLWVLTSILALSLMFDWILKTSRSMLTDRVGQAVDTVLSTQILKKVLNSKSEFAPNSIGTFAKQFQDFEGVRDFLNSMTITTIVDLPFIFLFLFIIYLVGGPLVIAPMVIMLAMLIVTIVVQPKMVKNISELSKLKSERSGLSFEALQQMDTLKLNNGKQWMLNLWEKSVTECSQASFNSSKLMSKLSFTTQLLQQWLTITIIVTGVYLISEREMTMGGLIAVTMLSGRMVGNVMQISTLITRWQQAKEGLNSINTLLNLPPERPVDEVQIERKSFHGDIKFHNVSFKYPESDSFAINSINLTIKPGEKIAILGGNGAGKTTLLKLLQSIYLPTQGRLLYDNLEAKLWDVDLLRKHIASCDQHPKLLKESIYKNITINSDGPVLAHHLAHALAQSGLDIILSKIEGGLEKKLGEGNIGLSGGQAQSVALARAFYKRSNLLILDEPTSMMDKNTEARVLKSLGTLPKTTTLIISTHNLNLLSAVDRVIIFEQGSVKYDGNVDNLRKKEVA